MTEHKRGRPRKDASELSKREQSYLDYIRKREADGGATKAEIIAALCASKSTADSYTQCLRRRGLIRPVGSCKDFVWIPVHEPGASSIGMPEFMQRRVSSVFALGAML